MCWLAAAWQYIVWAAFAAAPNLHPGAGVLKKLTRQMKRRTGDTVGISGDYQYRALTEGGAVQRFSHYSKQLVITRWLPPQPGQKVIDVGCGSGVISSFLGRLGAQVLGVDVNPSAVEFAANKFATDNVKFKLGLVDETFRPGWQADRIYCLEVIEHVYAHQALSMLRVFRSLLAPGGRVLLTTPNYVSAWPLIEWVMDTFGLAPRLRGRQHVQWYNRWKLRRLCIDAGFEVERITSYCFLAPWLAPLSWALAEKVADLEGRADLGAGAILACVLRRIADSGD